MRTVKCEVRCISNSTFHSSGLAFRTYPFDISLFLRITRKYHSLDPSFYIQTPGYPIFTDVPDKVNGLIRMFLEVRYFGLACVR